MRTQVQFLTINAAAKEIGLPSSRIRAMQKNGTCPGFFASTRFYVNVDMLREQLEAECRANAAKSKEAPQ